MASQAEFERLLEKLGAKRVGSSWMAHCPAHEDRTASMSVDLENGKILFYCHAGCSQESLLNKLQEKPIEIDHYDYTDENGNLLYQSVRMEPKSFRQRKPNGHGEWVWKLGEVRRVLFNLPQVVKSQLVIITEGEKDANTINALGYVATTNAMGVVSPKKKEDNKKWSAEYNEQLRGKDLIIVPDNDEAGALHVEFLTKELKGVVKSIGIARVPEKYKDISEWNPAVEAFSTLIKYAEKWNDEPKDWREAFHSYDEFENAPPLSFAIEGFLQQDGITAIAGLSGHGKTFVALSLARSLLFGPRKLWDWFQVTERAERVVYLIPESTLTPFKHRLKLMGLYEEIASGRLLVRTLSKGPTLPLDDKKLLWAVKSAHVFLDTGIRFLEDKVDEKSGSDMARTLSNDLVGLLGAGAKSVVILFHAPKEFKKSEVMTLENIIRGSGELGAILSSAWGIKQIDDKSCTIYVQNIKPRDFEPCGPFELMMRPSIDQTQDLQMYKKPGETGALHEEQPDINPKNNEKRKEARAANLALYKSWIDSDPSLSTKEIRDRFASMSINVKETTIRGYKHDRGKR